MSRPPVRHHVAAALKQARELRGLSISELARISGVAKATLSGLESGSANPTLDTLWALTAALKVSLGELLDPPAPRLTVVRAKEGAKVRGDAVIGRLLSSADIGTVREEIFDCSVLGKRQVSPAHARGVVEHILVTEGRLRVGPVDEPVELDVGDYLRMTPTWAHVYQALARGTRMTLVMHFPLS